MLYSIPVLPILLPATHAQLNTVAKAAVSYSLPIPFSANHGLQDLKYFGTVTDNPKLTDTAFVAAPSNTSDFGQITPGNPPKVTSSGRSEIGLSRLMGTMGYHRA